MRPTTRLTLISLAAFVPTALAFMAASGPAFLSLTKKYPALCPALEGWGGLPCQAVFGAVGLLLGAFVKYAVEYIATIRPLRRLDEVRMAVSDRELKPILKAFVEVYGKSAGVHGEDLPRCARISMMLIGRSWKTFFRRGLQMKWTCGFDENDRDGTLSLWLRQGVAGKALRERRPYIGLTNHNPPLVQFFFRKRPWGMFHWQREATSHVQWVLAVPLFGESFGALNTERVLGVLNLDVTDERVAQRLQGVKMTDPILRTVCDGLMAKGYLTAHLW